MCVMLASGVRAEPDLILIVPGSHLDIGFTDVPSKVRASRVATLDAAMDAAEKDPEFRWTEEGSCVVHAWLERHANDAGRKASLKSLLQSGRFAIGATWCSPHAALFPRSLHHLFAFNEVIQHEFGVQPAYAVMNDVPSFPEALVDAAAAAGVKGFLLGVNLGFSQPLPVRMTGGPFAWKSARGSRVVVAVDEHGYTSAFSVWGVDPNTARFFGRRKFGDKTGFAVTEAGIADAGKDRAGLVAVQQAFDNWNCGAAARTAKFAHEWNAAGRKPPIKVGVPADAFAAWEKIKLPVLEGEWGGDWETVRASCPVWTARLRHAAERVGPTAPLARRLVIATAMDHSGSLGPGWPNYFTEEQTKLSNTERAAMFREAIGDDPFDPLAASRERNEARLAAPRNPDAPAVFTDVLDSGQLKPQLVVNRPFPWGPFFGKNARPIECPAGMVARGNQLTLWARLGRKRIAGDDREQLIIGWDIPLRDRADDVRAWPVGAPAAETGRWLRGKPPLTHIAPDGLMVEQTAGRLKVESALAFAYRLADVGGRAHLQALLVGQSRLCALKGGERRALPFDELYPGEPPVLDAELVITKLPKK